jgi:hypothetical protein
MNAFGPYLIALHQQDLLEETALRRRVKLSQGSQPSVPAWRRSLGSGAHGLSGLFAFAARSLDPSRTVERGSRRSDSGVGRALAG